MGEGGSQLIQVSAGQTIDIAIYQTQGGSQNIYGSDSLSTRFSGVVFVIILLFTPNLTISLKDNSNLKLLIIFNFLRFSTIYTNENRHHLQLLILDAILLFWHLRI